MQGNAQTQLTPIPPRPTCNPQALFSGADCQDRWNLYNQAVELRRQQELQLYVNRQKAVAAEQATAPLQQQISDLNKLTRDQQAQIKQLHEQLQAQTVAATQSMVEAHQRGMWQGVGFGLGGTLVLFALVFGIRLLTRKFTIAKKEEARGASA